MAARPPRVTSTRRQPTTRAVTPRAGLSWWGNTSVARPPAPRRPAVASPAAPAVPAAPAAPQYSLSNLPVDATYDQQVAALQRQRDNTLAALTQQRTSSLSNYGFTEGPNGTLAFDPNNPFSQAALLKKNYDTNRRSTGQTLAAGGQMYSGAFQNAQDLINRNQLQSEDSLSKQVLNFLMRNTSAATEARTGYETAAGQAYGDRLSRFQSNPNYDPASGAPDAPGAAPAPSTAVSKGAPVTKTARGFVWAQNSNGTWRKVRPVNAFGH